MTHLPQIAAHADAHFRIAKRERDGRTVTEVERLDREGRIVELAPMLGGPAGGAAPLAGARELLDRARGLARARPGRGDRAGVSAGATAVAAPRRGAIDDYLDLPARRARPRRRRRSAAYRADLAGLRACAGRRGGWAASPEPALGYLAAARGAAAGRSGPRTRSLRRRAASIRGFYASPSARG